ncbi:putative receptor-like protein kinase [Apostasia shenzhenica]|uniref:non-specific serine/threonine protein kinase n=1 Tax=Apostasia shenzhenica TaxID=1088818 RepID=A0A2I0AVN7_9ASPA|nr:putative receptor-like protein kinase [Apostasia shenzhenica]
MSLTHSSPVAAPDSSSSKVSDGFPFLKIFIPVVASATGIILGLLFFFCVRKMCSRRNTHRKKNINWPMIELRKFQFDEIEKATNAFSEERLIGSGAFGNVYRGVFDGEKTAVAIKRAHSDSYQSAEEFRNEVELLSRVKHRNLVGLVGYCAEAGQRILVYEYVPHGSLSEYILGKGRRPLTWQQRVNIAMGAAKGIAHLHELEPSIIHRDVKPSNILIDNEFEGKVSDFGLVKLGPDGDKSHVSTQVKGTPGYMDPAYCSSLHLTPSSDVFSFGVILLQLVSACPVLDHLRHKSHYHISDWAKPSIEKGRVEEILDPNLQITGCNMKVMLKMANVGILCTAWEPKDRPSMSHVVRELEALYHLTKKVQKSSETDELQSISIDGIGLQRFSVEGFDDLSSRSVSLRCLDVNRVSFEFDGNNLSGTS